MRKIYKKIIPTLPLLLTKGIKSININYTAEINISNGSDVIGNLKSAVIQHHKPIIKLDL